MDERLERPRRCDETATMMKIAVVVGGRFYAFELARELQRRSRLAGIVTAYPRAYRERIALKHLFWNPWHGLRDRFESRLRPEKASLVALGNATRFGRWAAARIPPAECVQGWTGYSLETFRALRGTPTLRVAQRASAHIITQRDLIVRELEEFGVRGEPVHPGMVERELAEYAEADYVQVISSFARDSFIAQGFPAERLMVTPLGVDVTRVTRVEHGSAGGPLRVLYLGHVSFRKGIQYLLPAMARLGTAAELSLIGGVTPDGEELLRRMASGREHRGHAQRSELPALFSRHDVLILPSVEDGFGAVISEAMAAGLPVIASTHTGGPDVIHHGVNGLLVEPRNVDAIVEAIELLASDPERRRAMGEAAYRSMQSRSTWPQHVDDLLAQYGSACARKG